MTNDIICCKEVPIVIWMCLRKFLHHLQTCKCKGILHTDCVQHQKMVTCHNQIKGAVPCLPLSLFDGFPQNFHHVLKPKLGSLSLFHTVLFSTDCFNLCGFFMILPRESPHWQIHCARLLEKKMRFFLKLSFAFLTEDSRFCSAYRGPRETPLTLFSNSMSDRLASTEKVVCKYYRRL